MDIHDFTSSVETIALDDIEPSPDNPRGQVNIDASFERLVSSIGEVGILVPLVVRELSQGKYQLVDGERRYLAAKQLRLPTVPAHVLSEVDASANLRKFMFHLHMTREQWGPLAQCKSLAEMYPDLENGIKLEQKAEWAKRIARETWMNSGTARDRVHVLAWPKTLKKRIYAFDASQPDRDIYSYVLAIEASIIEPSVKSLDTFYNHGRPVDKKANEVRSALFDKTLNGIQVGLITSRDQIRAVAPLFQNELDQPQKKVAVRIFTDLVEKDNSLYDDAFSQIQTRLPEILAERPPKPQKLIGLVKSLTETLRSYQVSYIDDSIKRELQRRQLKQQLGSALADLIQESRRVKDSIK
jgi:ParB/RepB/Spo0J family partition protein